MFDKTLYQEKAQPKEKSTTCYGHYFSNY